MVLCEVGEMTEVPPRDTVAGIVILALVAMFAAGVVMAYQPPTRGVYSTGDSICDWGHAGR